MWVAREQNDDLYLFLEKPSRITSHGTWIWGNQDKCIKIDSSLFPNLKWKDEPIEISLVPSLLNSAQTKLAESVDEYFDYIGHAQDIYPYDKKEEQRLYDNTCWRCQDWNEIKYAPYPSPHSELELNFDDYKQI